ncbi:hypothetical protein DMB66_24525 [Actinoplanes sp. ATCC 53533]|nr:hypothetical protein DMB66_24525 [Actinoplanes sp. ATCC 53533]
MTAVATALGDLDEDVQGRVLRWAAERFEVKLHTGVRVLDGRDAGVENGSSDGVTEAEIAEEAPAYGHFAELFAKAQPKTDPDKALVAAYWVQVHEGNASWQSQTLNTQLKNLGHAVGNITEAMTSNIRKKPQRIIQLQKSGNSRQGRKTYKVTHEGMVYVQGMLGGGVS